MKDNLVSVSVNKFYKNISEKSILSVIKEDLYLLSGIYAFIHKESQKVYVGSSFNLAKRIFDHLNNRSSNVLLQRAFAKHGFNNISLYI